MKITRSQLKKLIKEEIYRLQEQDSDTLSSPISTSPQIQVRPAETLAQLSSEPTLAELPSDVMSALRRRVTLTKNTYERSNAPIDGRFSINISFDEQGESVISLEDHPPDPIKRFFGEEDDKFEISKLLISEFILVSLVKLTLVPILSR